MWAMAKLWVMRAVFMVFGLCVGGQMTALVEIAEAFRQRRSLGERQQQAQAFSGKPLLV